LGTELVPHKSFFKVRGKASGFGSDKFYQDGVSNKNGRAWKRIQFQVDTTPTSKIYVEMMGNEMDKAYAYNRKEKKTMSIDWEKRNSQKLPSGYVLIKPDYDKIDEIKEKFDDGDDVLITGSIQYSEYQDKPQYRCVIKNARETSKPINFEAENFKEENEFTQELTIVNVDYDKEEQKVYVTAYIIQDRGKNNLPDVQTAVFVNYPEKDKAFAKTLLSFKFGDTLKIQGVINSKIITEEIEQADGWGKVNTVITKSIKELEIIGAYSETYEKKKYKESDFDVIFAKKKEEEEIKELVQDDDEKLPWED
jgi:hypothetical protein